MHTRKNKSVHKQVRIDIDTFISSINIELLHRTGLERIKKIGCFKGEKIENYEHCKASNPGLCQTVKVDTQFREDSNS